MLEPPRDASEPGAEGLVEPLADSAPLAWSEAPRRCYRDPLTGETCVWYHRVWQYLRLLGLISSVRTNTDFLIRTFRGLARTGEHGSVLVAGTADYSMLAHLRCAYGQAHASLSATVVDRCETSLLLNRWYADRYGVALGTECGDAVEQATPGPFDVICTHNFLTRFEPDSRRRLIARWSHLLRPGGVVVTTQRVRPGSRLVRTSYSEEDARALSSRVATAAREHPGPLHVDPDELAEAVRQYAIRKGAYVVRAEREITDLFEAEGFEIQRCDDGGGASERRRDRPSSTAGPETYRMRLVARKRR